MPEFIHLYRKFRLTRHRQDEDKACIPRRDDLITARLAHAKWTARKVLSRLCVRMLVQHGPGRLIVCIYGCNGERQ